MTGHSPAQLLQGLAASLSPQGWQLLQVQLYSNTRIATQTEGFALLFYRSMSLLAISDET